jgi:16S rRNA processing protein RimM
MGEPNDRLVTIGEIARPHGLRGDLRVVPLTDDPDRFSWLFECVFWDAVHTRHKRRRLRGARRHGPAVVLSLAGCDTVAAAQALVGWLLAVPENEALPPGPGRFYPWQLTGSRVETEDGREVGTVAGIEASPAHDLWVVQAGGREHLVPAVPEIVIDVDLARRRVVIRPPDGLLDL